MEQKINRRIKVIIYKNFFKYLLKYSFKVNDNSTKHKYKSKINPIDKILSIFSIKPKILTLLSK